MSKKDNHSERIMFRATAEEKEKLELEAEKKGCKPSQLIRHKLFHRPTVQADPWKNFPQCVSRAGTEFKRLADFCDKHADSAKLEPIMASAKASMSFLAAFADGRNYNYYYPDAKRKKIEGTILKKATWDRLKNGMTVIRFTVSVQGREEPIDVLCTCPMFPGYLVKGKKVVIFGVVREDNSIYADVVMLVR